MTNKHLELTSQKVTSLDSHELVVSPSWVKASQLHLPNSTSANPNGSAYSPRHLGCVSTCRSYLLTEEGVCMANGHRPGATTA